MSDQLLGLATDLVDAVREQNWKNGGVHALDRPDAIGKVLNALRASYTDGMIAGTRHAGQSINAILDRVLDPNRDVQRDHDEEREHGWSA